MKIILFFLTFFYFYSFSQPKDNSDINYERQNILNNRISILLPKNATLIRFRNRQIIFISYSNLRITISEEYTLFPPEIYKIYKAQKNIIDDINLSGGKQIKKVTPVKYSKKNNSTLLETAYLKNFDETAISVKVEVKEEEKDSVNYYKQIADRIINSYDYGTRSILNVGEYNFVFDKDTFNIQIPNSYIIKNNSRKRDTCSFELPDTKIVIKQIGSSKKTDHIIIHLFVNPNYLYTNELSKAGQNEKLLEAYAKKNVIKNKLCLNKIDKKIKWSYSKEWKNWQRIYKFETILFINKNEKTPRFVKITIESKSLKKMKQMKQIIKSFKEI